VCWCAAGLCHWSGERHPNPFVSGELRAAGECGGCARTAGMGGVRAVGREEALPDIFCRSF